MSVSKVNVLQTSIFLALIGAVGVLKNSQALKHIEQLKTEISECDSVRYKLVQEKIKPHVNNYIIENILEEEHRT